MNKPCSRHPNCTKRVWIADPLGPMTAHICAKCQRRYYSFYKPFKTKNEALTEVAILKLLGD